LNPWLLKSNLCLKNWKGFFLQPFWFSAQLTMAAQLLFFGNS
jgi:hypothetical protein